MSLLSSETLRPGDDSFSKHELETKFLFHFKTVAKTTNYTFIDDSKSMTNGKPVETIYGRKFKLPEWEKCLASMKKGEIRKIIICDDFATRDFCINYVATVKCFRKYYKIKPDVHDHIHDDHGDHVYGNTASQVSHNCSLSIQNQPYKDLNELIKHGPDVFEFEFELVDAIPASDYVKDVWQMTDDEKLTSIPKLRLDGNEKFAIKDYENAAILYTKGLSVIESLMLKERPKDDDWVRLDEMKTPFLLNLTQVKLSQGKYYECIKYADEVLKRDEKNIKALFRRAKAHSKAWNFEAAMIDYNKCLNYNPSMGLAISKYIQELKAQENAKNIEYKAKYKNMF